MAGRPSKNRQLDVWMNGELVGHWTTNVQRVQKFAYSDDWLGNVMRRPLSLSLPLSIGSRGYAGQQVAAYFDNLLPDNDVIRNRLATRTGAASSGIFDLLEKIGRDCVGAVQLMPAGEPPAEVRAIHSRPLTDEEVAARLDGAISKVGLGAGDDEDEYRISIAGAQEKTALLRYQDRWHVPSGATPTTHIFKLPLGEVGDVRADFSLSVENEWLCAKIVQAYGLNAADCSIETFEHHKVLVVTRFDRKDAGGWFLRLPQEDFCQVFGIASTRKYESKGGPGMGAILGQLRGSITPENDRETFLKAQLVFWMLAATDGHAKNFSIFIRPEGHYQMTPLYDILSTWPAVGNGPRKFRWGKIKLAMALRAKNSHYRMVDIRRRHWNEVAKHNALGDSFEGVIRDVIERTPHVIEKVAALLPANFPDSVAGPIFEGLKSQAERLTLQACE